MTTSETWKPIPDFPGYDVSDHGRVRSYRARGGRGNGTSWHLSDTPQIMSQCHGNTGYRHLTLQLNKKPVVRKVHRLVLLAFVGPTPTLTHQGNHKNGIRHDNGLTNLEWVTSSENNFHSFRVLGRASTRFEGEDHPHAKLNADQVIEIRSLYASGLHKQIELARMFSISPSAIQSIVNRQTWSHLD